jgi:hypothetical protein
MTYTIDDLVGPGFWYLESPYTLYPGGLDAAAVEALKIAGRLLRRSIRVFAPVPYFHIIAIEANLDPVNQEFWLAICKDFVDNARGGLIANMEGWQNSLGIARENKWFAEAHKPIFLMHPEDLTLEKMR